MLASPRNWLPENHPVYLMLDILEELDLSAIEEKYQRKDPGRSTLFIIFYLL